MRIDLPYGNQKLSFELPQRSVLFVAKPRDIKEVPNESLEIQGALVNPVNSVAISKLARRRRSVVIVADDLTRPTPCDKIIPIVLDELNKSKVNDELIKIVIALGSHRPMTEEEKRPKFGNRVVDRIEVINHDHKDKDDLVFYGKTQLGTPIWINKEVSKAALVLGVGDIKPNLVAGWGGGAKIIQPGVSGEDTIFHTHLLTFRKPLEEIQGNVENMVRLEMEEVAKRVGLNMIINTVLNIKNEIVKVVAGDAVKAHRVGVKVARDIYCPRIPERADIVISSSHPADIDYWQAIKGVLSAQRAVKKGGTVILVTPCPEGISPSHETVISQLGKADFREIQKIVKSGEVEDLVGACGAMLHALMKEWAEIVAVSKGLTDTYCERLDIKKEDSIEQALEKSLKRSKQPRIGIITHGGDLLPTVQN